MGGLEIWYSLIRRCWYIRDQDGLTVDGLDDDAAVAMFLIGRLMPGCDAKRAISIWAEAKHRVITETMRELHRSAMSMNESPRIKLEEGDNATNDKD